MKGDCFGTGCGLDFCRGVFIQLTEGSRGCSEEVTSVLVGAEHCRRHSEGIQVPGSPVPVFFIHRWWFHLKV